MITIIQCIIIIMSVNKEIPSGNISREIICYVYQLANLIGFQFKVGVNSFKRAMFSYSAPFDINFPSFNTKILAFGSPLEVLFTSGLCGVKIRRPGISELYRQQRLLRVTIHTFVVRSL